ncbi:helix-turn-helix domain-containing protein [Clostridium thermopalmarium]|uniref:Helix-turn-helix domain protein n=1 Tax=Clostridium thermopalmarium DSM 5974 TaxID=1121340 RepID=A0A2T0APD6_9CLOT|nr:helix-turn-helix transcriptional regulator [Clostridium thermopalmarium]PRR70877.1 Helix-turn-helix domain protein [Clostridium thermopalmarium DSM 5974]PVZ28801.1 helix-turn-helix protein [Clostridium thermopalmarium DSM 5974]
MNSLLDNISWNKKIQVLRTIKGWTQNEAAKQCNTTQKVYWNWESGSVYPRKNSRVAIANAFDVNEDIIFKKEG